jgi:hypothetical protein
MADHGSILAWNVPLPGREQKALEVFMEAQGTYEKAVANGLIDSFETVLLQPTNGGLPGGWTISWGSEDQIDAWVRNDEYGSIVFKAGLVADGVAVSRAIRGDALTEGMTTYAGIIASAT